MKIAKGDVRDAHESKKIGSGEIVWERGEDYFKA